MLMTNYYPEQSVYRRICAPCICCCDWTGYTNYNIEKSRSSATGTGAPGLESKKRDETVTKTDTTDVRKAKDDQKEVNDDDDLATDLSDTAMLRLAARDTALGGGGNGTISSFEQAMQHNGPPEI